MELTTVKPIGIPDTKLIDVQALLESAQIRRYEQQEEAAERRDRIAELEAALEDGDEDVVAELAEEKIIAGLEGRVAMITGATSPSGQLIAKAYAEKGLNLVLIDKDEDALTELKTELAAYPVETMAFALDLEHVEDAFIERDIARPVSRKFGHLDVLVLNASVDSKEADLAVIDTVKMQQSHQINALSNVYLIRALHPLLYQSDAARVIFSPCLSDNHMEAGYSPYFSSMASLWKIAHSYALENDRDESSPIKVNWVDTSTLRTQQVAEGDLVKAYVELASSACDMGGTQIRITADDKKSASRQFKLAVENLIDPSVNFVTTPPKGVEMNTANGFSLVPEMLAM